MYPISFGHRGYMEPVVQPAVTFFMEKAVLASMGSGRLFYHLPSPIKLIQESLRDA